MAFSNFDPSFLGFFCQFLQVRTCKKKGQNLNLKDEKPLERNQKDLPLYNKKVLATTRLEILVHSSSQRYENLSEIFLI